MAAPSTGRSLSSPAQSGCAATSGGDDGSRSRAQPQPRPSRRHGKPGRPHRQERAPGPPAWTTATSPRYRAGHGAGRRIPASYPLGRMNAAQGRSTASSTTSTRRRCRPCRGPARAGSRAGLDRAAPHRHHEPPCSCGSRRRPSRTRAVPGPRQCRARPRIRYLPHSRLSPAPPPEQRGPLAGLWEAPVPAPATASRSPLAPATGCQQPWGQGLANRPRWAQESPPAETAHHPTRQQHQPRPRE